MVRIYDKRVLTQHLYNNSFNESNLTFFKNTMLYDNIRNRTELIKESKKYPVLDLQDIELELDIVILSNKEYKKLKGE